MDIHKRSVGDIDRKEEDIDLLDIHDFCVYLNGIYRPVNTKFKAANYVSEYETSEGFVICVNVCENTSNYINAFYYGTKVSVLRGFGKPWYEDLNNNFHVSITSSEFIITPKDGSKVTNKFFMEVIDFMLDHMPPVGYTRLINKVGVNESVWMDIHKHSNGDVERKEENVDLLNGPGFFEYLNDVYENVNTQFHIYRYENDVISVPMFETDLGTRSTWYIDYDCKNKGIYIWDYFLEKDDKLFEKLKRNYKLKKVQYDSNEHFLVEPKTGESSNKFFLEIIDFLLENANIFFTRILVKKDK